MDSLLNMALPISIALVPGLVYLTYVAKASSKLWMAALVGGAGWFLAFILRTPAFPLLRNAPRDLSISALALLAGFLEESVRYVLLKERLSKVAVVHESRGVVESFGAGWGLTEAAIIFGTQIPLVSGLKGASLSNLIAGSIERNSALLIHIALTFLIGYGVVRGCRWFLAEAILIHSVIDFISGEIALALRNVWLIELFLGLIALSIAVPVITLTITYIGNPERGRISGPHHEGCVKTSPHNTQHGHVVR